ncbi:DHA2 family efflux MFS transporter permease subunit [Paenibacillus sp.]|jgi:DHA2 family lincomycin resistance protein-like MFS transporter|uniref:DHA2 family efflux MFS transporter permease subunit n=1 Tax=Paenibacillus sp. TaxID=58172 RepID=UPI00282A0696|nr:DHA2 family efflux MFS transporter permease subunit [Paenibacillus sp.]MDR0269910.1 DHA2 family efflux MFS transporter permease subunit [Paenibacillus sp.]
MNVTDSVSTNKKIDLTKVKRGPIIISLLLGAFVAILNETLLSNALPDLMKAFGVTASTIQWLSTAYMLVVGVLVPVTAVLQQWFTTKQLFLTAMIMFLAGTLLAAFAPSFGFLLAGRIVQAFGTGLLLPIMMNTILIIFPPEQRGGAMGLMGLVMMFAPALGPTISGFIIDSLDWHWLFYMVIPFAVISIIIGAVYLTNLMEIKKPKVDILSIILSTLGFGGIVYSFSKSGDLGWSDPEVYWTLIIGAFSLVWFVIRQLRIANPILDLRTFRYPVFALMVVLTVIIMMTMFSTMVILPMFLQGILLITAFKSGLIMLPGSVLNGLLAPVSGKLFDKFGPRVVIIPGVILIAVAIWLFTGIDASVTTGQIIAIHCLLLIAIALVIMPTQTHGLNQLPPDLYPHGTAIFSTLQQVAGSIGTALFISRISVGQSNYLAKSTNPNDPAEIGVAALAGFEAAFTLGLLFSVIAIVVSLFIKRSKHKQIHEHHRT